MNSSSSMLLPFPVGLKKLQVLQYFNMYSVIIQRAFDSASSTSVLNMKLGNTVVTSLKQMNLPTSDKQLVNVLQRQIHISLDKYIIILKSLAYNNTLQKSSQTSLGSCAYIITSGEHWYLLKRYWVLHPRWI